MAETPRTNPDYFIGDPPLVYTRVLWIAFLSCFFVGQIFSGSYGAVAASVVAIFALPQFLWSKPRERLMQCKPVFPFATAFLLLFAAFLMTAEEVSDVGYIVNFASFALTLPIVVLARQNRGSDWISFIAIAALFGVICAFAICVFQVYGFGARRAGGFVNNPNTFAYVTLIFGVISFSGIYPFDRKVRLIFLAGPLLAFVVLLLTESRGALLSVIPVILFSLFFIGHKKGVRRLIFASSLSVSVLVGAGAMYSSVFDGPMKRFSAGSQIITTIIEGGQPQDWATYMRIELYKGAVRAFFEAPIVGHGWQDAIGEAASTIEGRRPSSNNLNSRIATRWPTMHNDFLAFAAGAGLFGILSYLMVLAAPLLAARKRDAFFIHRLYIGASLVSMTILHGLVNAPFGHGISIMTYAYLTAILIGSFQEVEEAEIVPPTEAA